MKIQAAKDIPGLYKTNVGDEDTDASWSSHELEEYLVDVNNGMDIDGVMAHAGTKAGSIGSSESNEVGERDEDSLAAGCVPLEVEFDENERVDISRTGSQEMVRPKNQCRESGSGMRHPPRGNNSGKGKHGYLAFPLAKKPPWDNNTRPL